MVHVHRWSADCQKFCNEICVHSVSARHLFKAPVDNPIGKELIESDLQVEFKCR